jgi:ABC-2 type transport system permease protein
MTIETAAPTAAPTGTLGDRGANRAVTGAAVRLVRRGTTVMVLLAGGLPAFVAVEYRDTFAGAIGVDSLAGLAENPAIRTLFGRPVALDDPGGFTVWRTGTVLAVLVGTWAVLTATRLTRGEEEAGRWELLWSCSRPPSRVRR